MKGQFLIKCEPGLEVGNSRVQSGRSEMIESLNVWPINMGISVQKVGVDPSKVSVGPSYLRKALSTFCNYSMTCKIH